MLNLAYELLDDIAYNIDTPQDLLALALCCQKLYQWVVPNHLVVRHIRCDILRKSLWGQLLDTPILISRIYSLDMIDETRRPPFRISIPSTDLYRVIHHDQDDSVIKSLRATSDTNAMEDAYGTFIRILSLARRLHSFRWNIGNQYIISLPNPDPDGIFRCLMNNCHQLQHLQIDSTKPYYLVWRSVSTVFR